MSTKSKNKNISLHHIMEAGFKKASESFSLMAGLEIQYKPSQSILINRNLALNVCNKGDNNICILTTNLLGTIQGASFLIFIEKDIDIMSQFPGFKILQTNGKSNGHLYTELLLKELDNILSANVITKISDQIQPGLLGGVPNFERLDCQEVNSKIDSYSPHEFKSVVFKSSFTCKEFPVFSPHFIWKINPDILKELDYEESIRMQKLILSNPYDLSVPRISKF